MILGIFLGIVLTGCFFCVVNYRRKINSRQQVARIREMGEDKHGWLSDPVTHAIKILKLCNEVGFSNQLSLLENGDLLYLIQRNARDSSEQIFGDLKNSEFSGNPTEILEFRMKYDRLMENFIYSNDQFLVREMQESRAEKLLIEFLLKAFEHVAENKFTSNTPLTTRDNITIAQTAVDVLESNNILNVAFDFSDIKASTKHIIQLLQNSRESIQQRMTTLYGN